MKSFLFTFLTIFSTVTAQWTQFNLNSVNTSEFKTEVLPVLYQGGLATGHSPFILFNETNRIQLGMGFHGAIDLTGSSFSNSALSLVPVFNGHILITPNLSFKGAMSGFSADSSHTQIMGFGLSLNFIKQDTYPNWTFNLGLGRLETSGQLQLKSVDANIQRSFLFRKVPIFFSWGTTLIRTIIYSTKGSEVSPSISGNISYVKAGARFRVKFISISPQLYLNTKVIGVTIDIYPF